jgi:hypothetical protein
MTHLFVGATLPGLLSALDGALGADTYLTTLREAERQVGQAEDEIEQVKKRGAKTRKELEGRIKELEQQNAAANEALRRATPTPAVIE